MAQESLRYMPISWKQKLIFDNSENKYQWVAEYDAESGQMIYKSDEVPSWVIEYVNKPKLSKL